MKTKKTSVVINNHAAAGIRASQSTHFSELVRRKSSKQSPDENSPYQESLSSNGVVLGIFSHLDDTGVPIVSIPNFGIDRRNAKSLVSVSQDNFGRTVVLGFEAGDINKPIILGFLVEPTIDAKSTENIDAPIIHQNGERVVIEAKGELELRCGDSVILLSQDGNIHIRGLYVTSHASASQRIRGGSVQIN